MKTKPVKQHTILWADDDTDDLFIVKEVLENIDDRHHIVEAYNGRQALEYLHSIDCPAKLPCLVILDINMPVLNGKETLAIIKSEERFSAITVVVFTTSSNEKDRQFCERFGAAMFTKPHSFTGFEKVVGELLTLCKAEDADHPGLN
jgi:CheY-like chemotaxis protein